MQVPHPEAGLVLAVQLLLIWKWNKEPEGRPGEQRTVEAAEAEASPLGSDPGSLAQLVSEVQAAD